VSVQVCFAGAEVPQWSRIAYAAGVRNFLFTAYPYVADRLHVPFFQVGPKGRCGHPLPPHRVLGETEGRVIMDSGLFTLLFGAGKGSTGKSGIFRWYDALVEYIRSLPFKPSCVEVDAQKIIGVDETWTLRERFREDLPGIEQVNVIHQEDGVKSVDRMIEFSDYVAVSCQETRIVYPGDYLPRLISLVRYIKSRKPGIKIHMLACTEEPLLKELAQDVTTADSTSWLSINRYGWGGEQRPRQEALDSIAAQMGRLSLDCGYNLTKNKTRAEYYATTYIAARKFLREYSEFAGPQTSGEPELGVK